MPAEETSPAPPPVLVWLKPDWVDVLGSLLPSAAFFLFATRHGQGHDPIARGLTLVLVGAIPFARRWWRSRSVVSLTQKTTRWSVIAAILSAMGGLSMVLGAPLYFTRVVAPEETKADVSFALLRLQLAKGEARLDPRAEWQVTEAERGLQKVRESYESGSKFRKEAVRTTGLAALLGSLALASGLLLGRWAHRRAREEEFWRPDESTF